MRRDCVSPAWVGIALVLAILLGLACWNIARLRGEVEPPTIMEDCG